MLKLSNSSVSNFIKFGTRNLSDKNIELLYISIKDYLRKIA